ncbi:VWA domain-containing protein [Roseibium sp.]|uniref:VWA domain-containing protein n=2 Tax=Roseibium sp. TaxID=1936156 RepID=UPI003265F73A
MDLYPADFSAFHFIRPWWLIALPATGILWWIIRRSLTGGREMPVTIAPHLAQALTVGRQGRGRILPIDGVALILGLLVLATAGPTWSRVPDPLISDTAPLVIALKVSGSMLNPDVPPNRLERAKHKIRDLFERRAGSKSALIAYSGSAHQVVPPTEDPDVLTPFLEGLDPGVMPRDGNSARDALEMADEILSGQTTPGAILFLLDGITDADLPAFKRHADARGVPVLFWFLARDSAAAAALEAVPGTKLIDVTTDSADVERVSQNLQAAYQAALSRDDRLEWQDKGRIFLWPAALLMLFWFRRGWTMRWSVLLVSVGLMAPMQNAHADGWKDWFLTPDQQGRIAFENKDYQMAADLFEDAAWKALALYRLGKYEEAAELYAWQDGVDAAVGEGLSLIRSRSYRPAVQAFEKAVERDPNDLAARHNLELSRYILDYIETTREQSDTGEQAGIGADDVVYDNEAGRGADSQQTPQEDTRSALPETAEQWMRTVDTRTGEFLKSRFAIEAARETR